MDPLAAAGVERGVAAGVERGVAPCFRIQALGFRAEGFEFGVSGFGFRV